MQLGRVIGNVVCTVKSDALEGKKLMLVQPLDKQLKEKGYSFEIVVAGEGKLKESLLQKALESGVAGRRSEADRRRRRRTR